MSKKKHPEHVNHERWLVSYADFITLLFAFFVVLFASGQNDKRKTVKLAQAMQSAFQYNGIFDQHTPTPPLSDEAASNPTANPAAVSLPVPSTLRADRVTQELKSKLEEKILRRTAAGQAGATSITLHRSAEGLVISLREAGLFNSGSAQVRQDALPILRMVAAELPHSPMRVEGHTDDVPIHTTQYPTNWELSAARAVDITRLLIEAKAVDSSEISASGFAEFRPVASNNSEAGRQQNRRVDIIVLKPDQSTRESSSQ